MFLDWFTGNTEVFIIGVAYDPDDEGDKCFALHLGWFVMGVTFGKRE